MLNNNAIIFSKIDKEDHWINFGYVFRIQPVQFYSDGYAQIKDKVESKSFIKEIIKAICDNYGSEEYLDGYTVKKINFIGSELYFTFVNDDEEKEDIDFRLSVDFVTLVD